jgi:hypothetical protein
MSASPLSARLLKDAALVARATGAAILIEHRGMRVTITPDSVVALPDQTRGGNTCDEIASRLVGSD